MTTWEYIRDLFRPNDRIVICWKIHTATTFHQRFLSAEDACQDRYQRFLRAMNAQGNNIYIGMNPIHARSRSRTKADIAEIRRVYLDVDHEADTVLNTILLDAHLPQPNYVLNTSPGKYQVIWNVERFEPGDAEALMRALCRHYGADPATVDISRVFRLPGLHNKKYEASYQVTARKLTGAIYRPNDFPVYDSASTRLPRPRTSSTLTNTPSHRDWAYVCRELWNASDPDAVTPRLIEELVHSAELRHKPKPRYYAELTVEKARAYIAAKRASSCGD